MPFSARYTFLAARLEWIILNIGIVITGLMRMFFAYCIAYHLYSVVTSYSVVYKFQEEVAAIGYTRKEAF